MLKPASDGVWRCSVRPDGVRPFWGRAAALGGGGVLFAYLIAAGATTLTLRQLGYPLSFRSVAWPPAWHEIETARARLFLAKANEALANQQTNEAILSLTLAYRLESGNYPAGRLLAHLLGTGQPALADATYRQLLKDHPEQRAEVTQAWYRMLLAHGNFSAITDLAADCLRQRPTDATAWLHATVFAARQSGELGAIDRLLATPEVLTPEGAAILDLERQLHLASPAEARERLALLPIRPATPYVLYDRARRWIRAGAPIEALALLNREGSSINGRERLALHLEAAAAAGWSPVVAGDVESLLRATPSPATIELLCAHLVRNPDPGVLAQVHARLARDPGSVTSSDAGLQAALFCAAGACGDAPRVAEASARLRMLTGSRFVALDAAQAFFSGDTPSMPIERIVPTLPPLPLSVVYALYERYGRRAPEVARASSTQ